MLQSSRALSVYTQSICLFGEFGLPGASIDDFYNRFYLIHLNFEINHCTERGRAADYRSHPKRQSAISAPQQAKSRFPPRIDVPQSAPPHHTALCNGTHRAFPLARTPQLVPNKRTSSHVIISFRFYAFYLKFTLMYCQRGVFASTCHWETGSYPLTHLTSILSITRLLSVSVEGIV